MMRLSRLLFFIMILFCLGNQSTQAMQFAKLRNLGMTPTSCSPAFWYLKAQEIKKQLTEQPLSQELLQNAQEARNSAKHAGQYSYAQQIQTTIEQAQQREIVQQQEAEAKNCKETADTIKNLQQDVQKQQCILLSQRLELQKQAKIIAEQQEQIKILKTGESADEKTLQAAHEREIKSLHNRIQATEQQIKSVSTQAKQQISQERQKREQIRLQTDSLTANLEEEIKKLLGKNNILKQNQQLLNNEKETTLCKLLDILQELSETKKLITEEQEKTVQGEHKYYEAIKQVTQLTEEQSDDSSYTKHLEMQIKQKEKDLKDAREKIAQLTNTIDILESTCESTESFRTIEAEDNEKLKAEIKELRNANIRQLLHLKECQENQQRLEQERAKYNIEEALSTTDEHAFFIKKVTEENKALQNQIEDLKLCLTQKTAAFESMVSEYQMSERQYNAFCEKLSGFVLGKNGVQVRLNQETLKAVEAKINALAGLSSTVNNLNTIIQNLLKVPGTSQYKLQVNNAMQNLTAALGRKGIKVTA